MKTEITLRNLRPEDGKDIYNMLQNIGSDENEFHNDVNGMSFTQYKEWLETMSNWAQGEDLPEGYVRQWIFWLYDGDVPVGMGKLREKLTLQSRDLGGNIGYAISVEHRGKGYGNVLFSLLLQKAKELGIEEVLSTVEKTNPVSKAVQLKCGGKLIKENEKRWYFSF